MLINADNVELISLNQKSSNDDRLPSLESS